MEAAWIAALTAAALGTRLWALETPATVTYGVFLAWDEAHFGKFAGYYVKRAFYFDVHPPLGKLVLGGVAAAAGFDGQFEFPSGEPYPADVPYVAMRAFCAGLSALAVPLVYGAARQFGLSRPAAVAAAAMVLLGAWPVVAADRERGRQALTAATAGSWQRAATSARGHVARPHADTAQIALGRLILLDSALVLGTALTLFALAWLRALHGRPFTWAWWAALAILGVALGLSMSVKWVGFFSTAWVGLFTLWELWNLLGDQRNSLHRWRLQPRVGAHFAARSLCLILVPFALYCASFALHFAVLTHSGPGDSAMPSLFQAGLVGSKLGQQPEEVHFGSTVTLRNHGHAGALLHSHVQTYPAGSKQQQVTAYSHLDENNYWVVLHPTKHHAGPEVPLRHNQTVVLLHKATNARLHSHAIFAGAPGGLVLYGRMPAPITPMDLEVSGYNALYIGDPNDFWVVEVLDEWSSQPVATGTPSVRILSTPIRLRHVGTGCYLWSHPVLLPEWGFQQHEVTCRLGNVTAANAIWNVEEHQNAHRRCVGVRCTAVPNATQPPAPMPFWRKFAHLNDAMLYGNNALVPDPTKVDNLASRPYEWPLLRRGLRMNGWGNDDVRMFLLGSPAVWWGGAAALVLWAAVALVLDIVRRRSDPAAPPTPPLAVRVQLFEVGLILAGGWTAQYLPYWLMGRVTYLHHYVPAVLFLGPLAGVILDAANAAAVWLWRRGLPAKPLPLDDLLHVAWLWTAVVVAVFVQFAPAAYGMTGPQDRYAHLQWRAGWTIVEPPVQDAP